MVKSRERRQARTSRASLQTTAVREPRVLTVEMFEELVGAHLDCLYGFAMQRMRKPADAEDLVQDTLLRAWDRLDTLEDEGRIRSWLISILINLHRERSRKSARRQRIMPLKDLDERFDDMVASGGASPLDEVLRQGAAEAIQEALAQVPEAYAMAVELRDLEGLSYQEIAQILEIPKGTVMSRIARGRKVMAQLLVEWRINQPESRT